MSFLLDPLIQRVGGAIVALLAIFGAYLAAKRQGAKNARARQTEQDMKRARYVEEKADAARNADKSGTPDERLFSRGRLRD